MKASGLNLILVSTPIGYLGSGKGGGVELTITSLIKGLLSLGHKIILIAPEGSKLPSECSNVEVYSISGKEQESCQHKVYQSDITIPNDGILPKLWEKALEVGANSGADAIINFSYDWLPIWLTTKVQTPLYFILLQLIKKPKTTTTGVRINSFLIYLYYIPNQL